MSARGVGLCSACPIWLGPPFKHRMFAKTTTIFFSQASWPIQQPNNSTILQSYNWSISERSIKSTHLPWLLWLIRLGQSCFDWLHFVYAPSIGPGCYNEQFHSWFHAYNHMITSVLTDFTVTGITDNVQCAKCKVQSSKCNVKFIWISFYTIPLYLLNHSIDKFFCTLKCDDV